MSHFLSLSVLELGDYLERHRLTWNRLIQSSPGLGAVCATLIFSINLAAFLYGRSPSRDEIAAKISPLLGLKTSVTAVRTLSAAPSTFFLTPFGSLVSDWRRTIRLTGLIPLYVRLRSLVSQKVYNEMDPILRHCALLQCGAYIIFQAMENTCHLHNKGIIPHSIVDKRGGVAKWVTWSCRAWCVGVLISFLRLWREAEIENIGTKTAEDHEAFRRRWWNEFMVSACWLPVAVHASRFHPDGIRGMNAGTISFLSLVAVSKNLRTQWRATA